METINLLLDQCSIEDLDMSDDVFDYWFTFREFCGFVDLPEDFQF